MSLDPSTSTPRYNLRNSTSAQSCPLPSHSPSFSAKVKHEPSPEISQETAALSKPSSSKPCKPSARERKARPVTGKRKRPSGKGNVRSVPSLDRASQDGPSVVTALSRALNFRSSNVASHRSTLLPPISSRYSMYPSHNSSFQLYHAALIRGSLDRVSGNADPSLNSSQLGTYDPQPQIQTAASAERKSSFDLEAFKAFTNRLSEAKCHRCNRMLEPSFTIDQHVERWMSNKDFASDTNPGSLIIAVHCPAVACAAFTCLACGSSPSKGSGSRNIKCCCEQGWLAAAWLLLTYIDYKRAVEAKSNQSDRAFDGVQHNSDDAVKPAKKKKKTKKMRGPVKSLPKGVGYATGHENYDMEGEASAIGSSQPEHSTAAEENRIDVNERESRETIIISMLTMLLRDGPPQNPSNAKTKLKKTCTGSTRKKSANSSAWDFLPSLFNWSRLLVILGELFRNDSVEEVVRSVDLYMAALDLTEALLDNSSTAALIRDRTFDAQKATGSNQGHRHLISLSPEVEVKDTVSLEEVEGMSVGDSMANLTAAGRQLLKNVAFMPDVYKDNKSKQLIGFCQRLDKVGSKIGVMAESPSSAELPQSTQSHARVEMVDEKAILERYTLSSTSTFKESTVPRRMRTLFHELGVLTTSLPHGIFLKVAMNRPDMIKALIVGPEGTPYSGGLFEFDILCPANYPQKPPTVQCVSAMRSETRWLPMNPNLYNSGYVCLSLINTWHGGQDERWQPGKSTLLQVLVSIQSMVLGTATPADNEPGGLHIPHEEYNRKIQLSTILAALLPWLPNSQLSEGIWSDVVKAYFKANAQTVLETVRSWSEKNKKIEKYVENWTTYFAEDVDFDGELSSPFPPPPPPPPPVATASTASGIPVSSLLNAEPSPGADVQSQGIGSAGTVGQTGSVTGHGAQVGPSWPPPQLSSMGPPPPPAVMAAMHAAKGLQPNQRRSGPPKEVDLLKQLEEGLKPYL